MDDHTAVFFQCLAWSPKITFGTKMDLGMTCKDARAQVREFLDTKASTFGGEEHARGWCLRCGHQGTRKRKRSPTVLCCKCLYQCTVRF